MNEESIAQILWHVIERTWGALLAIGSVFGGYLLWLGQRVVHLDKHKLEADSLEAIKSEFTAATLALGSDIRELVAQRRADNAEFFGALRAAVDRQSATNVDLTKAVGELTGEMHARRQGVDS